MSTKKAVSKRIRVTRTGKVLRRAMSQCHFRSRQSSSTLRRRKLPRGISDLGKKIIRNYS